MKIVSLSVRLMLLVPVWCFASMSFAQHPVTNVLEQMKDRAYQFEVKGITELKVEWPASETGFRTVTIPNHYVVGRSGDYASLFYQVRNPEEEVLISDGKVIATVDPKRTFQNSACLENRGVLFFPFYLLNEFYNRKVVSEEEIEFIGEDDTSVRIKVQGDRIIRWNDFEVIGFEWDRSYHFQDPKQLGVEVTSDRDCRDYFTNVRRLNATLEALKNE